ncbi:MAG: TetR family transcriptional regulator, partial [Luminiphilus sp.]|nr:TetR family transcriptional regulator [Luminiphilus sp.]
GYIRDGISDGSIRECHSTSTARALLTALDWSFYWLYEMPESQSNDAKAAIRALVTSGLMAGDSSLNAHESTVDDEALNATEGFNREAQNRIKQEAFLRAGIRQFNQKGFSGTSLDDIAESLNVSKGAFYYHFSNKEALLMQCYEFGIDQLGSLIDSVAKLDLSPTQKLKRICTTTFLRQNSALGPMIRYNSITSLPPPLRRQILARTEAHHARLSDLLSAGVAQGEVIANNMLVVRYLLVGAINGVADFHRWRRLDNPVQAANDFFDVFFHGLALR